MSASDAAHQARQAPLPRLGEVFFDVRGDSRSMRLSWYADTGVAVFSIWQGGTCTGTFRLPIADLPRMVAALRRGPGTPAAGPARRGPEIRTGEHAGGRPPDAPGPPPRHGLPGGHRGAPPPDQEPTGRLPRYEPGPPAGEDPTRASYSDESPVRPYVSHPAGEPTAGSFPYGTPPGDDPLPPGDPRYPRRRYRGGH